MLDKMLIDASHMRPSTMTTKVYDGSPRLIIRNIDVELIIGPQPFQMTLQVMNIHPLYKMLLEGLGYMQPELSYISYISESSLS